MTYDPSNIFARILRGEADAHRVYEDERAIAILDVMPQSDGHTLVIPRVAAENLFDLPADEAAHVMRVAQKVAAGVRAAFSPAGVLLMQFNGAEAGQTVFHFHLHIVPRYAGVALRTHGRGFADPAVLTEQAARLRDALRR